MPAITPAANKLGSIWLWLTHFLCSIDIANMWRCLSWWYVSMFCPEMINHRVIPPSHSLWSYIYMASQFFSSTRLCEVWFKLPFNPCFFFICYHYPTNNTLSSSVFGSWMFGSVFRFFLKFFFKNTKTNLVKKIEIVKKSSFIFYFNFFFFNLENRFPLTPSIFIFLPQNPQKIQVPNIASNNHQHYLT